MARTKANDNLNKSGNSDSSDPNVVLGGTEQVSTEDIRHDEGDVVNPGEVSAGADTITGEPWFPKRNKRGRKVRASKETASDLNGLLWMLHQGIASLTGIEEFALDASESKELAEAVARVQAFYPNSVLSPVMMAWTGLIVTSGKLYGTRFIAYTARKKQKPEVVEMPMPPGTRAATATEL